MTRTLRLTRHAEHITRIGSVADLFGELGLTIEAAPDVEDFVENNLDGIVDIVNNELSQYGLQVDDVEDAEIDEAAVSERKF